MTRLTTSLLGAAASLLLAGSALAQKINQPWTAPRGGHESRVISCQNPVPAAAWKIAADDWICPKSGPITAAQWWGEVNAAAQLQRRYFIAIWTHNPQTCRPLAQVYRACVVPSSLLAGQDCNGRRVYRFSANLPAPYFTQAQGQHYWFQVSEDDSSSVTVGAEDFRWASHLPISPAPLCQAVQINGANVVTQPTLDDCQQPIATDLAFRLFGPAVIGHVPLPLPINPSVYTLRLKNLEGDVLETHIIQPDTDGSFVAEPDNAGGTYFLELDGMGFTPTQARVTTVDDGAIIAVLPPLCKDADFNGDGDIGTDQDIESFFRVLAGQCR